MLKALKVYLVVIIASAILFGSFARPISEPFCLAGIPIDTWIAMLSLGILFSAVIMLLEEVKAKEGQK